MLGGGRLLTRQRTSLVGTDRFGLRFTISSGWSVAAHAGLLQGVLLITSLGFLVCPVPDVNASAPALTSSWSKCTSPTGAASNPSGDLFVLVKGLSCGSSTTIDPGSGSYKVVAVNAKGRLKSAWGRGGIATPGVPSPPTGILTGTSGAVTLSGDGYLFRLNSKGKPDTSFGTGGLAEDAFSGVVVQLPDGGYVRASGAQDPWIERLDASGDRVSSFGISSVAKAMVDPPGTGPTAAVLRISALTVADDGSIYGVLIGSVGTGTGLFEPNGPYQPGLVHFSSTGVFNSDFGDQGVRYVDLGPQTSLLDSLSLSARDDGAALIGRAGDQRGNCVPIFRVGFSAAGGVVEPPEDVASSLGCYSIRATPSESGGFLLAVNPLPSESEPRMRATVLGSDGSVTELATPKFLPDGSFDSAGFPHSVVVLPSMGGYLLVGQLSAGWCDFGGTKGPATCRQQVGVMRLDADGQFDSGYGWNGLFSLPAAICSRGPLTYRSGALRCPRKASKPRVTARVYGTRSSTGLRIKVTSRTSALRIRNVSIHLPLALRLRRNLSKKFLLVWVGGSKLPRQQIAANPRKILLKNLSSQAGTVRIQIRRGSFVTKQIRKVPEVTVHTGYVGGGSRTVKLRPSAELNRNNVSGSYS